MLMANNKNRNAYGEMGDDEDRMSMWNVNVRMWADWPIKVACRRRRRRRHTKHSTV